MLRLALVTACLLALSAPATADFEYVRKVDLMTDTDSSFAFVKADGGTASLLLRCNAKKQPELFISTDRFLDNEPVGLMLRFDSDKPKNLTWNPSTDGGAVFAPGNEIPKLANRIRRGQRLVVRLFNYQGTTSDHVFNLAGSQGALSNLACF